MATCKQLLTFVLTICGIVTATVSQAADRAVDALDERCVSTFVRVPLDRIAAQLGNAHRVRITFLDNVKKDTAVTFTERGKTLRYVLNAILTPQNLAFEIRGDEIVIGPPRRTR